MKDLAKKILYSGTRLAQAASPNLLPMFPSKNGEFKVVLFYPEFESINDLEDQISRMKWYIPEIDKVRVMISVSEKLKSFDFTKLQIPFHHRNSLENTVVPEILDINELNDVLHRADIVCLWNAKKTFFKPLLFTNWSRIRIVDPDYYLFAETHSYPAILWYDLLSQNERNSILDASKENFLEMFNQLSEKKSYVFGTGPSIKQALEYDFSDGIRIICNSMVKDDEMLEHIQPQVLIFLDSVFHFGVSKYSGEFAKDVLKVVRKYHPYIITNQVGAALMQSQYPKLREKIIAVPALRFGSPVRLTPETFYTRDYPNVLTRYLLPLASGLSNEVDLLGFDGRAPAETYFWKHNSSTQYGDKMDSTQLSHPAFFRDINYDGYYEKHCKVLHNMIKKFEKEGVSVHTLTQSFVPALSKRQQKGLK